MTDPLLTDAQARALRGILPPFDDPSYHWCAADCGLKATIVAVLPDGKPLYICEAHQDWAAAQADAQLRATPDAVNHPPHYTAHPSGVECITITEHMSFCIGNAIKYLWRADHKNGVEDLEKAAWYVQREIARVRKLQEGRHDR